MPVTTRRRAAALSAVRRSSLKKPTTSSTPKKTTIKATPRPLRPSNKSPSRNQTPQSAPPTTTMHPQIHSPTASQKHRRRRLSLPNAEPVQTSTAPPSIACRYGHRLYNNKAKWGNASIVSPTALQAGRYGLQAQARFYERQLARIGAELAATGEAELWRVHGVVDLAVGMLRGVIAEKA